MEQRIFPEGQVPTVFGPNQPQRQVPITNFTSPTPSKLICVRNFSPAVPFSGLSRGVNQNVSGRRTRTRRPREV